MDNHSYKQVVFQVKVKGLLSESWEKWFSEAVITSSTDSKGNPITTLSGVLADQPALRGLMMKIWDLNLDLISLKIIENGPRVD